MAAKEPSLLGGPPGVPDEAEQRPGNERAGQQAGTAAPPPPPPPRAGATGDRLGDLAREARASSRAAPGPVFHAAGFWRRLLGAGIDATAILPVALILTWLAGQVVGFELPASRHRGVDFWLDLLLTSDPAMWGAVGLATTISVIYLLLFQVLLAQTPGMRLLKMRVIDVYGDEPSVMRCAVRTAGYLAGIATLGLGFLWVGFDSERRGLHDWISGTYVVKA
jgi:uncharacterized RDD family membrane protein YckC